MAPQRKATAAAHKKLDAIAVKPRAIKSTAGKAKNTSRITKKKATAKPVKGATVKKKTAAAGTSKKTALKPTKAAPAKGRAGTKKTTAPKPKTASASKAPKKGSTAAKVAKKTTLAKAKASPGTPAKRGRAAPAVPKKAAVKPSAPKRPRSTSAATKKATTSKPPTKKGRKAADTLPDVVADVEVPTEKKIKPAASSDGPMPEIDVVISFDTTGSMSSCINEVRKHVTELVNRLFTELTSLRIGIVAHGDYCDEHSTYLMKQLDLTDQAGPIVNFIKKTGDTGGGDTPEAYEYVLREVQKFSWRPAAMRSLVMIGDAYPHEAADNPHKIDWKHEVGELKKMNVAIYAVQALNSGFGPSHAFYKFMAEKTSGYHLFLDQFSYVRDMLIAVCIRQCGEERLTHYEQELIARPSGMTNSMRRMFDTMLGRKSTAVADVNYGGSGSSGSSSDLRPCPPSKYQVLHIGSKISIKAFVLSEGLRFKTGKGFYEFTKPEIISEGKEIVLMKKSTGELFEGAAARSIAGITSTGSRVAPGVGALGDYRVFVQSTSYNRVLVPGTGFLYEAEDYGRT